MTEYGGRRPERDFMFSRFSAVEKAEVYQIRHVPYVSEMEKKAKTCLPPLYDRALF
jgi:hypothetical protein